MGRHLHNDDVGPSDVEGHMHQEVRAERCGGGGGGVEGGGEGGRRVKTLGRSVLNLAANTNHTTACGECAEFCSEYK